MHRRDALKLIAQSGFSLGAVSLTIPMSGCGTIFHKERIGQHHNGQIDWKIVALDGLGLILFFVPGVVAFAVDFSTGAIYLPPHESGYIPYQSTETYQIEPTSVRKETNNEPPVSHPPSAGRVDISESVSGSNESTSNYFDPEKKLLWSMVSVKKNQINLESIERAVSNKLGQTIQINESVRVSSIGNLNQFRSQFDAHNQDKSFGLAVRNWVIEHGLF